MSKKKKKKIQIPSRTAVNTRPKSTIKLGHFSTTGIKVVAQDFDGTEHLIGTYGSGVVINGHCFVDMATGKEIMFLSDVGWTNDHEIFYRHVFIQSGLKL